VTALPAPEYLTADPFEWPANWPPHATLPEAARPPRTGVADPYDIPEEYL
jgi:hypothetical protein